MSYLGIIAGSEIQHLREAVKTGTIHPVAALALQEPKTQVAINTEMAARLITEKDPSWLSGLKTRLVDTTDFTNASSALGELRAYGALLETRMTVVPEPSVAGKKVIPEFEVDSGDGKVIVEVHSRQLAGDQAQAVTQHHRDVEASHQLAVEHAQPGRAVATFGELEVTPFGGPDPAKAGDSVLTNAINRLASIKQNERQIDTSKPFVLWLDLQDPTVWKFPISEEHLSPLYTEAKDGEVGTGALWFALYGRKGDPMIETEGFTYQVRRMLHDGRFYQAIKAHGGPTHVSAVVYSMPCATVLMENPAPLVPLPPRFRASLLKAPFFRLDRSICEWENGLVKRCIEVGRESVRAAAAALSGFNIVSVESEGTN